MKIEPPSGSIGTDIGIKQSASLNPTWLLFAWLQICGQLVVVF